MNNKQLDAVSSPETELVNLMTQYLHAYGPRMLGDVVMNSLVKYSKEDGDKPNKLMLFSHVVFGMSGEVYNLGLTDEA